MGHLVIVSVHLLLSSLKLEGGHFFLWLLQCSGEIVNLTSVKGIHRKPPARTLKRCVSFNAAPGEVETQISSHGTFLKKFEVLARFFFSP